MKSFLAVAVAVTILAALVVAVMPVGALTGYDIKKPYYTTGDGKINYQVLVDSDCWKSLYIRATPKYHNTILTNYQYIYNLQPTSSTKDFSYSGSMLFKILKFQNAVKDDDTDPRLRVYVTWKLTAKDGDVYQGTDTQYMAFIDGKTVYTLPRAFLLHTDPAECS